MAISGRHWICAWPVPLPTRGSIHWNHTRDSPTRAGAGRSLDYQLSTYWVQWHSDASRGVVPDRPKQHLPFAISTGEYLSVGGICNAVNPDPWLSVICGAFEFLSFLLVRLYFTAAQSRHWLTRHGTRWPTRRFSVLGDHTTFILNQIFE
jgi:hypothetical protein